jgi:hypothetical protein
MTALEIITVLIVLVIIAQIILNSRKKNSEIDISASPAKSQDKVTQSSEPQPTANTEPTVKPQSPETQSSHKPAATIVSAPIEVSTPENNCLLPQDSILRRHYLAHLCNMLESLAPVRPTDSVLARHYDAMLATKLMHCLNNEKALEQLLNDYESNQPAPIVEPSTQPQVEVTKITATQDNSCPLPQDSVLRRHYLAHISSMIESLTTPRPTDSVLIRHYEAILAANLVQCLTNKEALKQLVNDYESQK